MRWEIHHRTRYEYVTPVRDSFNELRLKPPSNEHQRLESYELKISPPSKLRHYTDFYANWVDHFDIADPHTALEIEAHTVVSTQPAMLLGPDSRPIPLAEISQAARSERFTDYLEASGYVDVEAQTWRLAVDAIAGETDAWQAALAMMRFVNSQFAYESQSTHVHTHMREVVAQRRGVCQDFAHVMLGMCRTLKLPALYVSGYLATEGASATHAWLEVFIPGVGWCGLDPVHNCQPDGTYVKIAVGRDYGDVQPVKGVHRGARNQKMLVEVKITRGPEPGNA